MTTNESAFDRARRSIPGGVNSPVRAFGSVGGIPRTFVSARGPYITDVEGREYVDLVGSWGPAILGHAHPAVLEAVHVAVDRGLSFGASTLGEAALAEAIRDRVRFEWPSTLNRQRMTPIDQVRMVSTGTEATMTAIRLARGATGRDLLVKFAGHYHGHSDALLAESGSGVATLSLPGSAGVTAGTAADTLVIPYNDLPALETVFEMYGPRIAAVIVEAAAANMGVVPPEPGFNAAVRAITKKNGALMIADEVLTGFRVGSAGWWGLEASSHAAGPRWVPDLFTFGKVVGGGMPLAALGGPRELLEKLAPLGPVYQAGTLSGNPVAVAAGIATLEAADAAVYTRIDEVAGVVAAAASAALSAEGVEHSLQSAGNLFSISFRENPPRNYSEVRDQEAFRHPPFFHAMLDAGVSLPPSVFEAWFVSAAHDDTAVARILDALPAAAKAAAAATP